MTINDSPKWNPIKRPQGAPAEESIPRSYGMEEFRNLTDRDYVLLVEGISTKRMARAIEFLRWDEEQHSAALARRSNRKKVRP